MYSFILINALGAVNIKGPFKLEIHTPGVVIQHLKDPSQKSTFQTQNTSDVASGSGPKASVIILKMVTLPPGVVGVYLLFGDHHT